MSIDDLLQIRQAKGSSRNKFPCLAVKTLEKAGSSGKLFLDEP
jgi:hypothetical protein